jgi:hypothetical protein
MRAQCPPSPSARSGRMQCSKTALLFAQEQPFA